jgi:hypothetical protein
MSEPCTRVAIKAAKRGHCKAGFSPAGKKVKAYARCAAAKSKSSSTNRPNERKCRAFADAVRARVVAHDVVIDRRDRP